MKSKIVVIDPDKRSRRLIEGILASEYEVLVSSGVSEGYSAISTLCPDLIIIDGGKGQLSFAMQAIEQAGLDIKVISLAKREEEIFVPHRSQSILLDKSDPALRLIMEIRDEVHRFAITYHRLLRNKALLQDNTTPKK